MAGRKLIQVRLDEDLVRQIDHEAVERDRYRWEVMEEALRRGLTQGGDGRREEAQR